MHGLPCAV